MKILVSACLLGIPCRYDGAGKADPAIEKLRQGGHTLIPVCPEILGGLPTPRPPAERLPDGRVPFRRGAGPGPGPEAGLCSGGPEGALPLLRPGANL